MNKMNVSVVMINYNTYDLTKDAIESILKYTSNVEYEIILIDNKSPDGSGEKLRDYFGDKIKYVDAGGNLGTAKSFNIGARMAQGKYVIWLNPDILFIDNFLYKLYSYMEGNPSCGICGGNLVDKNMNPIHSYRLHFPCVKEYKKDYSIIRKLFNKIFKCSKDHYNRTGKPMKVAYITGADMMMRKSILEELNYFDEDIFMYGEETEFTYRVSTKTKYDVISVPDAKMIHLEGQSFGPSESFSEWRFKTSLNGTTVYLEKSFGVDEVKRYYRLVIKKYKHFRRLSRLMFKKGISDVYTKKIEIVKQKQEVYLNEHK